mmetsp:Transcript_4868/g.9385  ORF Transcript_4868/g.9385 Transcript_4868/m.9385 type:complete len:85 (+) Transcript_4868:3-257(+)
MQGSTEIPAASHHMHNPKEASDKIHNKDAFQALHDSPRGAFREEGGELYEAGQASESGNPRDALDTPNPEALVDRARITGVIRE